MAFLISFGESANPVGKLTLTYRLSLPDQNPRLIRYRGHAVIGSLLVRIQHDALIGSQDTLPMYY